MVDGFLTELPPVWRMFKMFRLRHQVCVFYGVFRCDPPPFTGAHLSNELAEKQRLWGEIHLAQAHFLTSPHEVPLDSVRRYERLTMLRGPHLTWAPSQALPGPSQHLHGMQQCTGAEFLSFFNEACFSNEDQQNPWCLLALGSRCLAPAPTPSLLFTAEAVVVEAVLTNGSDITTTLSLSSISFFFFFKSQPISDRKLTESPEFRVTSRKRNLLMSKTLGCFRSRCLWTLHSSSVYREMQQNVFTHPFSSSSIFMKQLLDLSGPSQSGPGQYPNYPQGQGQQYAAYRPPQPGPPQGQQQRPYGYDQVSIATTAHAHQGSPPHLS